jgi:hypothetical protein
MPGIQSRLAKVRAKIAQSHDPETHPAIFSAAQGHASAGTSAWLNGAVEHLQVKPFAVVGVSGRHLLVQLDA